MDTSCAADGMELGAINGNPFALHQSYRARESDHLYSHSGYGLAMHSAEFGNRLVVRYPPSQQPHQLDGPSAFRFQPPRGTNLLEIAVEIQLQQVARIITRSPGLGGLGALKSQTRHVQPVDKRIDHPAHVILGDQLFQADRKQSSLRPAFSLHKAHKKCPRSRKGIFALLHNSSIEFRNSLVPAPLQGALPSLAPATQGVALG